MQRLLARAIQPRLVGGARAPGPDAEGCGEAQGRAPSDGAAHGAADDAAPEAVEEPTGGEEGRKGLSGGGGGAKNDALSAVRLAPLTTASIQAAFSRAPMLV